jgi:tetratricopeptide (TPR) repeat protein
LCVDVAASLDTGDTLLRAELAVTEAQARLQLSEHDEALRVAERALDLATELAEIAPDPTAAVAAHAHSTIGIVLRLRKRYEEAADHLSTAAATARRVGLHHRAGRCLFNLGAIRLEQGDFDRARAVMDQAADEMRTTGDTYGLARVLHGIAVIHEFQGESSTALALYDEACALKEQLGDAQGLANSRHSRALTLRSLGRVDEALTAFEQILASPAGHSEPWARASYLDSYATTLLVAGRIDEAPRLLREAMELARNTGGLYTKVTECHLALALLAGGEPELARKLAAEELPARNEQPDTQLDARLLRAAVALYHRDGPAVLAVADELARWVSATGYLQQRHAADRLVAAAAAPPAPAELPRLLWLGRTDEP